VSTLRVSQPGKGVAELGDVLRPSPRSVSRAPAATRHPAPAVRALQMGERRFSSTARRRLREHAVLASCRRRQSWWCRASTTRNLGDDVTYSGTVSAAMEGRFSGCVDRRVHCWTEATSRSPAAWRAWSRCACWSAASRNTLLTSTCRRSRRAESGDASRTPGLQGQIVEQTDPRGRSHYWIGGAPPGGTIWRAPDMGAVHDGYVL